MNVSTSSLRRVSLPRIAIVGRPNVGKSTLFNRIVGSRHSITDPTPGVTRDVVEAVCSINGRDMLLIDTGGYQSASEGISELVSKKSIATIEEADVVLLLVEVTQLTAEDEELIEKLRRFSDKLILAVNKTDNEQRESNIWDFHSLGFKRIIPISAEHGRNIEMLINSLFELLPPEDRAVQSDQLDKQNEMCLAILGKPNTGKSTLLNTLAGYSRAIVSPVPGTTRDVLETSFIYRDFEITILDTAGIRRKKSIQEAIEYYSVSRAISSIKRTDVVFLLIDAKEGVTDQDKKIADQIVKQGRGVIIVLSKWDMIGDVPNAFNAARDSTRYFFPQLDFAPIVPVSGLEGTGLQKLLDTAIRIRGQLRRRIPAHELNTLLRSSIEHHPPPYGKKRYRAKYLAQTASNPLRFALYVNKVRGFPSSWASYLVNNLRRECGIDSVPISIELRGR
jgi:GTP-binding protein